MASSYLTSSFFSMTSSADLFNFSALKHSVCKLFRQWGAELVSNVLFNCMLFLNPRLTPSQQSQLLLIMSRAMDNFLQRGALDDHLMRSLLALASPDHGTCLLLNYLLETFTAGLSPPPESPDPREDVDVSATLIKQYGIDRVTVSAMPPGVRKAVLKSLGGSSTGTTGTDSSPVCCITLEPLLWPDCRVSSDVVAVLQRDYRAGREDHAFLYKGRALYEWLGRRQLPVCPETRSVVKMSDVYRLS